MVRQVKTNLSPEDVNDTLLETFEAWISFALGLDRLGGKMLKEPSGRLAASLRAEHDRDGYIVALYVDPDTDGAEVNDYLLNGHRQFSMKDYMLKPGHPSVHKGEDGYLSRAVPIADTPKSPSTSFAEATKLKNMMVDRETPQGGVLGINKNLARMWTKNYERAHKSYSNVRTMSNRPGSAGWVIPAMPAFNAGKLLKDMIGNKKLKDRVII